MQQFLSEWSKQFSKKDIQISDFTQLIQQLGQFDQRCAILNEEIIQFLYEILKEKQNNQITIEGVQALVSEFILKDRVSITPQQQKQGQANNFQQNNYNNSQSRLSNAQQQMFQNPMLQSSGMRTSIIQKNNVTFNLLQSLTIDKLSEMQYIFSLCDNNKSGEVNYEDIENKYKEMNMQDKEASLKLFNLLKDEKQIIKQATFNSTISELESILLQSFYQQKNSPQNQLQAQPIIYQNSHLEIKFNEQQENEEDQENESLIQASQNKDNIGQQSQIVEMQDKTFQYEQMLKLKSLNEQKESKKQIQRNIKESCNVFSNLVNQKIDFGRQNTNDKKIILGVFSDLVQMLQKFIANIMKQELDFIEQDSKIEKLVKENDYYRNKIWFLENSDRSKQEMIDKLCKQNDILEDELNQKNQLVLIYEKKQSQFDELSSQLVEQETQIRIKQKEIIHQQQQIIDLQTIKKEQQEQIDLFVNYFQKQKEKQLNIDDNDQLQIDDNDMNPLKGVARSKQQQYELKWLEKENERLKNLLEAKNNDLEQQKQALFQKDVQMENATEQLSTYIKMYDDLKQNLELEKLTSSKISQQQQLAKQSSQQNGRVSLIPRISILGKCASGNWGIQDNNQIPEDQQQQQQQLIFAVEDNEMNRNSQTIPNSNQFILKKKDELKQDFSTFWDDMINKNNNNNCQTNSSKDKNEEEDSKDNRDSSKKRLAYEKAQVQQRYLEFNEEELFARDYLNLREDERISTMLKKYAKIDKENLLCLYCFSDMIFRINSESKRDRRIIFITYYNIYIMDGTKNMKLMRLIPLDKIEMITFSETSANLLVIHVKFQNDILIESYRRAEMNLFLLEALKERNISYFSIKFCNEFKIRFKEQKTSIITNFDQNYELKNFQGAYKDAIKVGFLEFYQNQNIIKKIFKDPWKENFIVLCSVGLLLFEESGSMYPILFIPVSGANLCLNPQQSDINNKKYIIKIFSNDFSQEFLFAAKSKPEQLQWYDAIHKIIVDSLNSNALSLEQTSYSIAESIQINHDIKVQNY